MLPPCIKSLAGLVGLTLSPDNAMRAALIANLLPVDGVDVVVLCEAFDSVACDALTQGLKARGLPYSSPVRPPSAGHVTGSGLCVVSRYPITSCEERPFGFCLSARDDCLADKAVVHCAIAHPRAVVHVFATHTQAWNQPACEQARRGQLLCVRQFMDAVAADGSVVVVAGDMNICRYAAPASYLAMLDTLGCVDAVDPGDARSFDAGSNELARSGPSSGGVSEHLDYILVRQGAVGLDGGVLRVKAAECLGTWNGRALFDVSDHYPVRARLALAL